MSTVNVTVSVSSSGVVSCSPDPVGVSGADALIAFTLASPGYAFPSSNAITVTSPASQFPYGPWTSSSTAASLFDVNSDSNTYKYTVHLIRLSDSHPIAYDPTIENGKI
jgi:hypothetical protein